MSGALSTTGKVVPFGSWVAGLHTPGGDVDMSLVGPLSWQRLGYEYAGDAECLSRQEKVEVLKASWALPAPAVAHLIAKSRPQRLRCMCCAHHLSCRGTR